MLADWAGLARDAAACATAAGQHARVAELLEQGRAVLWSQLLDGRGDLSRVQRAAPQLADRMDQLRARLEAPVPDNLASALGGRRGPHPYVPPTVGTGPE